MNHMARMTLRMATACLFIVLLSGCLKDKCGHTYTLYKPVYKTLAQMRADIKGGVPRQIKQPGKLYLFGNYIFLNETNQGIHVIDNSQPNNPQQVSFINIPGNVDLAVRGNTLYADCYGDLVMLDISNPREVSAKKVVSNVFPHRYGYYKNYNPLSPDPDKTQVIVGWTKKDTTIDCETYRIMYSNYYSLDMADIAGNYVSPQVGGVSGSMARFTLAGNYLYTVTNNDLKVFDISNPWEPDFKLSAKPNVGAVETIFPFKDKLFIGANSGMAIFDIGNAGTPQKLGQFVHATACDPVVADDQYAYVTLRSGTECQNFTNQLDVVDIRNLLTPSLKKTYKMFNPHGLSKDGNLLFICDGKDGLKVYDAGDVMKLKLIKHITGIETYDVIARKKKALVVAREGLYQFDYTDPKDIRLISIIHKRD